MICRLIIITIIIIFSAPNTLIIVCIIVALIHLIVKPYASKILNVFDGLILHMMIYIVSIIDPHDSHSNYSKSVYYTDYASDIVLYDAAVCVQSKD